MQYFGVPTCPYCKKRVNLIRTWSLKRQGEYQCPRCGGISNIYLSPLIYVFALLAIFAGGAVYFFHKFILDDISLSTTFQVLLPFIVFFLLSLFMVYLAKPVIKKVPRAELEKKKRGKANFESRRAPAPSPAGQMFYDEDEYLPKIDYRTGPLPQEEDDRDMKVVPPAPRRPEYREEMQKTSVVEIPPARAERSPVRESPPSRARQEAPRASQNRPARPQPEQAARRQTRPAQAVRAPRVSQAVESRRTQGTGNFTDVQSVSHSRHTAASVSPSSASGDFFAKYDDPEYVERRLRELNEKKNGGN